MRDLLQKALCSRQPPAKSSMSDISDDDLESIGTEEDVDEEEEEGDAALNAEADGEEEEIAMVVDDEEPEPMDTMDDTGAADTDDPRFQKVIWQLKYLPYSDAIEEEADQWFVRIKDGLAHAILKRSIRPDFMYWLEDLQRYLGSYSLRFTKTDHVNLIKLLYNVVTMKDCDFRLVKCSCRVLNTLLSRKELLSRNDLVLEWRPLYELYVLVSYKNLEDDGLFLLPDRLKNTIESAIIACRTYFPKESTREILNEVRPCFCIWDDAAVRGITIGSLFLNTLMDKETTAEHGAGLWFDEFWHWYEAIEVNNVMEGKLVSLFMRLARDCVGFVDWKPKYDFIISKIMRCLNLTVGTADNRVSVSGSTPVSVDYLTVWLTYLLGGEDDGIQSHLERLFKSTMSYFHPSNGGSHTSHLLSFVNKLCSSLASRLRRERYRKQKKSYHPQVPQELQLTDKQVDQFVGAVLPCVELAAFTKHDFELVPQIFRYLGHLAPWQVVPAVIDMVYSSLDALTEPHRLLQSLSCLSSIILPLVRDKDDPPSGLKRRQLQYIEDQPVKPYRIYAINLLRSVLPGIDVNDIAKSLLTFQIIGALLSLIPLVDCSNFKFDEKLTQEERELCEATAAYDEICEDLLEKMFRMLEIFKGTNHAGTTHGSQGLVQNAKYSIEEAVIRRGLGAVFRCVVSNSGESTTRIAVNKVYEFAKTSIFDSKIAADTVAELIFGAIKGDVQYAMPMFLDFLHEKLVEHITPDMYEDEEVDSTVLWYVRLIEDISRVPYELSDFRPKIDAIAELMLKCKNSHIYDRGCSVLENILLFSTSMHSNIRETRKQQFQDPNYISIQHWAEIIDKKSTNCQINWVCPGPKEYAWAMDLMNKYLYSALDRLKEPKDYKSPKDMLKDLKMVCYIVDGAAPLLPLLEGEEFVGTECSVVPKLDLDCSVAPKETKELMTPDGKNVRKTVMDVIIPLVDYLLEHKEDDTKSFKQVNHLLKQLIFNSGISKSRLSTLTNQYHFNKKIKGDPVRVSKATVATLHQEFVALQHARRLHFRWQSRFNESHFTIIKALVRLGMCDYSSVRIDAQQTLVTMVDEFPFVVHSILDDLLKYLKSDENISHEQFKGALYMLINGKGSAVCLSQSWRLLNKIWPALVMAQQSEKRSIIQLLDTTQNLVVENFESFQIKFTSWRLLNKIWPALVMAQQSEKRSIIQLLDTTQNLVVENFESFQIKFTTPYSAINTALELVKEGENCVHRSVLGVPTNEELEEAKEAEKKRNAANEELYYKLCESLYKLSNDTTLHWRHLDMAQSFLSMLIRKDQKFPDEAVLLFHRLIVHDSVKTRKMAQAILGAWMRMNKPKAIKDPLVLENVGPNNGPNAKWPIKYGIRVDNRPFLYDKQNLPNTKEKWDNIRFLRKVHHGFYTWPENVTAYNSPENVTAYNSPGEQKGVNRSYEELTQIEKDLIKNLSEEEFMNRFIGFMSLEEKKGQESFNAVQFMYYYGLFRNFNDMALAPFKKPLERLMASKKEEDQRLASEIVAGLLNGSKMWTWEKVEGMWTWLQPNLLNCLENVSSSSYPTWGTAIATVLGSCDPRSQYRLVQLLENLATRPTESSYHNTVRYYLLQAALNQGQWRVTECWNDMFRSLAPQIVQTYQNFRERIGSCIATLTYFDIPGFHVDEGIEARFKLVSLKEVLDVFDKNMGEIWDEALRPQADADAMDVDVEVESACSLAVPGIVGFSASSSTASLATQGGDDAERKRCLLALSTLLSYLQSNWNHSLLSLPQPVMALIPLLMHFENEKTDEDIKKSCAWVLQHGMSASTVAKDDIPLLLKTIETVCLRARWWKAKLTLLKFMQCIGFANYHILIEHQDSFKKIVFHLLMDTRLEVRQKASETLSGFIQCGFFTVDDKLICGFFTVDEKLINEFKQWSNNKNRLRRHAGVLALSAIVRAYPYTVPPVVPDVLMKLCRHAHELQPIQGTVKETMKEFKRTHTDMWHVHKQEFTEDQLADMTDLLVSPNYYV
uniref:BLM10_mid domain-containing protein n=1 Tax=Steinernema glaseri TaxID=37863 RepID=A0A1I7YJA7_9BILA